MNSPLLIPFAILGGLVLAAVATSFFAIFRGKSQLRAAGETAATAHATLEGEVQAMRQAIEGLTSQLHDVQQQPRLMAAQALPKPGLNLTKRSQALRMHRRGDLPDQIAAALEIPSQEVDLLLKVHKIVMSSVS